jgi:hypothetical protein
MTQNVPDSPPAALDTPLTTPDPAVSVEVPCDQIAMYANVAINMLPMVTGMMGQSLPPQAVPAIQNFLGTRLVPGSVADVTVTTPGQIPVRFVLRTV